MRTKSGSTNEIGSIVCCVRWLSDVMGSSLKRGKFSNPNCESNVWEVNDASQEMQGVSRLSVHSVICSVLRIVRSMRSWIIIEIRRGSLKQL